MIWLKSYVLYAIIGSVMAFGGYYVVKSYFVTKAKLTQAQDQLAYYALKQVQSEKQVLIAEREILKNLGIQRHAVKSIIQTGHLPGKSNPDWMSEYASPSVPIKHGP